MNSNVEDKNKSKYKDLIFSGLVDIGKFLVVIIPLYLAFTQYVDDSIQSRIDRAETRFSSAVSQLESGTLPVKASGLRTIYELTFQKIPTSLDQNIFSPIDYVINSENYFSYRFLDRGRSLFKEFMSFPREVSSNEDDLVSTTLAEIALNWVQKESELGISTYDNPKLWFFFRAYLPKANIPSKNFENLVLVRANFDEANLSNSFFDNVDMRRSLMRNTNLRSSSFKLSKLKEVDFSNSNLSHTYIISADLRDALFKNVNLSLADLSGSDCTNSDMSKSIFQSAKLNGANFSGANLSDAVFDGAFLTLVDFSNANLTNADFRFSRNINQVKSWEGATLDGTLFPPNFNPSN